MREWSIDMLKGEKEYNTPDILLDEDSTSKNIINPSIAVPQREEQQP